jgi:RHS repeat-associated protein
MKDQYTWENTRRLDERYEYDAFGKPYKGDFSNGVNFGYTGKPYDAVTGLYNYGYRETARFTTVDPVRDGSNWFAYVNNDPVNWVDLWGLETVQVGVTAAAGGGSGGFMSSGLIAAWDPSNPLSLEIGTYTTQGIGSSFGASVSGSIDITTSMNPTASGIANNSVVTGGSFSAAGLIGVGANSIVSMDGAAPATSVSIGAGVGTPVEGHIYYSNTQIKTTTISLQPVVDKAKSIGSSLIEKAGKVASDVWDFFTGSTETNKGH